MPSYKSWIIPACNTESPIRVLMHTNAAWDTSTNREWPSICFTKSTVSCKSWGKVWQPKPSIQHEDDSTHIYIYVYIYSKYIINRTMPGFSINYHISPSWCSLKYLRESFPLPVNHSKSFRWKQFCNGKTGHHPVLCVCLSPSFIEQNPHHHRWIWSQIFQHGLKVASDGLQKNVDHLLIQGKLVNMSTSLRWHGLKSETMFHWRRHLWDHLAPSTPSERPPCFLGCAWSHPTFHQHPKTSKWTLTQNRQTNQWMDWKTTHVIGI